MKRRRDDLRDKRDGLLSLANLAHAGKRYNFMFEYTKKLVECVALINCSDNLSNEERHLFKTACFSLIKTQRDSYNYVTQQAAKNSSPFFVNSANEYLQMIASEIKQTCTDVIIIIDRWYSLHLSDTTDSTDSIENMVFYGNIKGDFQRYLVEVSHGVEKLVLVEKARQTFLFAQSDAIKLNGSNPIRLNLDVSLAQFYALVLSDPREGYKIAKQAFDLATYEIRVTYDPCTVATTEALERLQNHIDLWKKYGNA